MKTEIDYPSGSPQKHEPSVQLPLLLILVSSAIRMSKTCPSQSIQFMRWTWGSFWNEWYFHSFGWVRSCLQGRKRTLSSRARVCHSSFKMQGMIKDWLLKTLFYTLEAALNGSDYFFPLPVPWGLPYDTVWDAFKAVARGKLMLLTWGGKIFI